MRNKGPGPLGTAEGPRQDKKEEMLPWQAAAARFGVLVLVPSVPTANPGELLH